MSNLQNLPNRDERSDRLKACIIPKLDSFLFADYASMEIRILAYFMSISEVKDNSLANELLEGKDVYVGTAVMAEGTPYEDVTAAQRQRYKQCALSVIYGGGAATLLDQGIVSTKQEGWKLLDRFYSVRPGIKSIDILARQTFADRGYVRSYWGRELRPLSPHKALNYIIQGSGSDIMKDAMIKIHEWLEEIMFADHTVLSIHDELGWDCRLDAIPFLAMNIPALMDDKHVSAIVPLTVELATGPSWAKKRAYIL